MVQAGRFRRATCIRFGFVTADTVKTTVFLVMTPCRVVEID